jgi:signal transduction histidine kinase
VFESSGKNTASEPPDGEYARLRRRTVRAFALAAAILLFAMAAMGAYILNQFRGTQVRDAAEAGQLYIEGLLAPYALSLDSDGKLPEASRELIRGVLSLKDLSDRFYVLTIWGIDAKIIYSTEGEGFFGDHDPTELIQALAGNTVVDIHDDASVARGENIEDLKLLEIYAPIFSPTDGRVVAVGEIYMDATSFLTRRAAVERSMWLAVAVTTLGLLSLLSIVARQRLRLVRNLTEARRIAEQNRILREAADSARRAASRKGEQILNEVGAELHDGPIQMLGYMMLLDDDRDLTGSATGAERRAIAESILADLRAISAGLILPEIKDLTVGDTLRLAVTRHENATATQVALDVSNLPETLDYPLRICLYRLVQEGLRNAFRHAGGSGQKVGATVLGDRIEIVVSDDGEDQPPAKSEAGLGLSGLRNRLEIFGGTLDFVHDEGRGSRLIGRVPLGPFT